MKQTKLFKHEPLGNTKGSYYIIKLTNEVSYSDSTLKSIRDLVAESDDLYPGIEVWFDRKVIPGIKEGRRYAYVVIHEGKPIVEAIVKRGEDTKLCSMRIKPAYQNKSIGPFLFSQIAGVLDSSVLEVHFTAPESLVIEREGMFERLGFVNVGRASRLYRVGEEEFVFRANGNEFRKRAIRMRAEIQEHRTLSHELQTTHETKPIVLSIRPNFAKQIINQKKTVEIRTRFSSALTGTTVFLYATKPLQAVVGEAVIGSVVRGEPREIWDLFKERTGCTHSQFREYCRGVKYVYAVVLEEILPYPDILPWEVFTAAFDAPIRPPQCYSFLKPAGFTPVKEFKMIEASSYKKQAARQMSLF